MSKSNKYTVYSPNRRVKITTLNAQLAERQKITDEQLEALKMSHQIRHDLFNKAEQSLKEPLKLRMLARLFDTLESEQQKLWNFPVDNSFHLFHRFPGCKCPKIDNDERIGIPYKIISEDCPIHKGDVVWNF